MVGSRGDCVGRVCREVSRSGGRPNFVGNESWLWRTVHFENLERKDENGYLEK